jgi:adenosylmethionine-8-amino-7-oxononanoate aminotransferase
MNKSMTVRYPHGHVFYRNLHRSFPLISHGKGVYLFDTSGKKYLDASGGAAVVNIGHGVKEIASAISSQALKTGYINGTQFSHMPVEVLAEQVSEILPFADGKVYFLTSGSEAVEASIKLARQFWIEQGQETKYQVISRKQSYHGNTLAALALSDRQHYKSIYRPMILETHQIPAPYCYRCFCGEEYPSCGIKCALELEKQIRKLGEENVSAFLTEIIGGGSSGAAVPPKEYFDLIRNICEDYGILLIADEILTGIGRTGEWMACGHFELKPDIIVLGKGLTSGYVPLSAVAASSEIVDAIHAKGRSFLHAQTFAHHPVGCAAGVATLSHIKENGLLEKSRSMGTLLIDALAFFNSNSHVGDIRGKGLLVGIEFVRDKNKKTPFEREIQYVEKFISRALEKGLVLWPNVGHADGLNGDLVLLAPPFVVNEEEISQIKAILGETLDEMNKTLREEK